MALLTPGGEGKVRYLIVLILAIFVALPIQAEAQGVSDPRIWSDSFMQTLIDAGPVDAHKKLQISHLGVSRPHAITGVLENMKAAEMAFGQALGYEFISQRDVGQSLRIFNYYTKRKISVVLWKFVFYRPRSDHWLLVHFKIGNKISDLGSFY